MPASEKGKENFQVLIDAQKKAEFMAAIDGWVDSHPGSRKGDALESVIPEAVRMLAAPADPSIAGDIERISKGVRLIQAGVTGISTAFGSLRAVIAEEFAERLDSQAGRIVELCEQLGRYENGWEEPGEGPSTRHPSYEALAAEADELRRQAEELKSELASTEADKREAESSLNERLDAIYRVINSDFCRIHSGDVDPSAPQSERIPKADGEQGSRDESQGRLDFDEADRFAGQDSGASGATISQQDCRKAESAPKTPVRNASSHSNHNL